MRWDDEARDPSELAPDAVELTEREVDEALALLQAMSVERLAELAHSEVTDHCTEAIGQGRCWRVSVRTRS